MKLTVSTLKALQERIEMDDLPLTFKHAIEITKQLGYRYLWIDSLHAFCFSKSTSGFQKNGFYVCYVHACACRIPDKANTLFAPINRLDQRMSTYCSVMVHSINCSPTS